MATGLNFQELLYIKHSFGIQEIITHDELIHINKERNPNLMPLIKNREN